VHVLRIIDPAEKELENISRGANEKHFWKLQDVLKVFTQNHYLNTAH
jgi:hypothetical protein